MSQEQVQDRRSVRHSTLFCAGCLVFWEYAGFQNTLTYFPREDSPSSCSEQQEERGYFKCELGVLFALNVSPFLLNRKAA